MRPDAAEIEPLQSRQDRRGALSDLLRLGRGEYEDDPRRRLLEDLEEGVPRLAGEHMRFVHDVHLVAPLGARGVHRALTQVARVVHTTVGGGVQLHDVQIRLAGPDPRARLAHAARLASLTLGAVQGHRQDARGRGLPYAAGSGEEVPMRRATARHGAAERGGHVILDDQLGELARTVFASERDHLNAECEMRNAESNGRRPLRTPHSALQLNAPGSPQRHPTSLSAAPCGGLTRFASG